MGKIVIAPFIKSTSMEDERDEQSAIRGSIFEYFIHRQIDSNSVLKCFTNGRT